MKTLGKVIAGIVILAIVLLVILRFTGFPPTVFGAGLWLSGNRIDAPVTDWSFTDNYPTVEVQTRSWYGLPHSVIIYCVTYNGRLYLSSLVPKDAPQYPRGRQWNRNVAHDPHVRLKVGDNLYDLTVTYVTDPAERDAVIQNERKKYPKFQYPADSTFNVFRATSSR